MKRVAVIGGRGHTGSALLPLLQGHPSIELIAVGSSTMAGTKVSSQVPNMDSCTLEFESITKDSISSLNADAVVLALPNQTSQPFVSAIDSQNDNTIVVDLSADHRFDGTWAYGQPERFAETISKATRIANPGCYATGAQLSVAPLLEKLSTTPSVFGVSGYSGAGKKPNDRNDPQKLSHKVIPYALVDHVHSKEVARHIGVPIHFHPHVAQFFRGISLTISATLKEAAQPKHIAELFQKEYAQHPLIDISEDIPDLALVQNTHQVSIGGFVRSEENPKHISFVCVLDNLLKGAATQAVQNLNLAFGLDPLEGIHIKKDETP